MKTLARFKTLADAQRALYKNDYSKAIKPGKKGWRNARYEISLICHPDLLEKK